MYRPASRALLRTAQSSLAPGRTIPGRRFLTTEPPHLRSRSWKSSAARWGLAIAGIYFYNTSPVFADQPALTSTQTPDDSVEDASLPTLDALAQKDRSKQRQSSVLESAAGATTSDRISHEPSTDPTSYGGSPAGLEEEASQEGAFNPETGEINWDCPCLGGMAHGPCGEDFKAAFSCFVFSTEEPKGMDCIDNFKKMQDCFREHPDVYAGELADDDDEDGVMAEGLEGEKADLQREIQERRKAVQERQAQRQSTEGGEAEPQRRLLEEAPAASSTKPVRKSSTAQKKTQPQPPAHSEPTHQTASDAADESRETLSEPAPSQLTKKPYTPPVQDASSGSGSGSGSESGPGSGLGSGSSPKQPESNVDKFDADLELQPKSWHDARDAQPKEAEQQK